MIVIERTFRYEVETWEDAQNELRILGIILLDYAIPNIEAGRPFVAPVRSAQPGHYITVRHEPDDHR